MSRKKKTTTKPVKTEEEVIQESAAESSTLIVYSSALSIGYDFKPIIEAAKILEKKSIHFVIRAPELQANDMENIKNR